jgi:hypothetical protein
MWSDIPAFTIQVAYTAFNAQVNFNSKYISNSKVKMYEDIK